MSISARLEAGSVASRNTDRVGSRLLLVNGTLLATIAFAAGVSDLAGHFFNAGPMARALYGNLDTIGVLEAHGLALILAVTAAVIAGLIEACPRHGIELLPSPQEGHGS